MKQKNHENFRFHPNLEPKLKLNFNQLQHMETPCKDLVNYSAL